MIFPPVRASTTRILLQELQQAVKDAQQAVKDAQRLHQDVELDWREVSPDIDLLVLAMRNTAQKVEAIALAERLGRLSIGFASLIGEFEYHERIISGTLQKEEAQ